MSPVFAFLLHNKTRHTHGTRKIEHIHSISRSRFSLHFLDEKSKVLWEVLNLGVMVAISILWAPSARAKLLATSSQVKIIVRFGFLYFRFRERGGGSK